MFRVLQVCSLWLTAQADSTAEHCTSQCDTAGNVMLQATGRSRGLKRMYKRAEEEEEREFIAAKEDVMLQATGRSTGLKRMYKRGKEEEREFIVAKEESYAALKSTQPECPGSGLAEHEKCWYLSDINVHCMTTCANQGLSYSWYVPETSSPMMPKLVGNTPADVRDPWGVQECYRRDKDRFFPAKADGNGQTEPHKLNKWYCEFACPCSPVAAYTLVGTGIAGPDAIWNIGSAQGKGASACFAAVLNEATCRKEYFTYNERGDQNCGCKSNTDALSVEADDNADYYRMGEDLLFRAVGSFLNPSGGDLRYGPKKGGYDAITCYMACSTYTYIVLTKYGRCSCDNDWDQVSEHGPTGDCSPRGSNTCRYVFTTNMDPTPAPTAEGPAHCGDFDVKLEGANGGRGTPMLYVNGLWQPICSREFKNNHFGAQIFCKQLGYEFGALHIMGTKIADWAVYVQTCANSSVATLQACDAGGQRPTGTHYYSSCGAGNANEIEVECFGGDPQVMSCGYEPPAPAPLPTQAPVPDEGEMATFLMQATFGPTRSELARLAATTYDAWIQEQMQIPMESHREAYRSMVNPAFIEEEMAGFDARTQCTKGSFWHRHAFVRADIGKSISVKDGGQILVDGVRRSDIDPAYAGNSLSTPQSCNDIPTANWQNNGETCASKEANIGNNCLTNEEWIKSKLCQQTCFNLGKGYVGDDCSGGWAKFLDTSYDGFICDVFGTLGAFVQLGKSKSCSTVDYMQNPGIWFADSVQETSLSFEENPKLDMVFLAETQSAACELENQAFVNYQGRIYRHEARMALRENTIQTPTNISTGGDPAKCVPKTFLNQASCVLQPPEAASQSGCFALCGSIGEVSNTPSKGHQLPLIHNHDTQPDFVYDSRYAGKISKRRAAGLVWTAKALNASDQLRQRTAWALAQIVVVGQNSDDANEKFVNFYDIFVRNAFGNYRDVLREVTFSPVMATYLTYERSRCFDSSSTYPDENYAREIMQLFTIGLYKLHANGSAIVDASGKQVDTYTNDHITNLARVFTGFWRHKSRANIEGSSWNNIDPVWMDGSKHDKYPKPNLDQGYLGDGHPLCSEMPARAFLMAGAKYELIGYSYDGAMFDVYEPNTTSPLYMALSSLSLSVTLTSALGCHGKECSMETVGVVKAGAGFYRYMPPTCVYYFFYNGRQAVRSDFKNPLCVDGALPLASTACCAPCAEWVKSHASVSDADRLECTDEAYLEVNECNHSSDTVAFESAVNICSAFGLEPCGQATQHGCAVRDTYVWTPAACSVEVTVHEDGQVFAHTDKSQNRFAVIWTDGKVAPPGAYSAQVEVLPVFDAIPSAEEVLSLKTGAFAPSISCTHGCSGDVKVYSPSGNIDVDTTFEYEGKLFKNVKSIVRVGDFSFINPPSFFRPGPESVAYGDMDTQAAAVAEVESLIDHLFHHPNTPVFISKKLIQRFTTSNPSPTYLVDVVNAFKTGTYNGVEYSGEYGDLGATIAAILLHPEARSTSDSGFDGSLREPLLKLIHLLRALEYEDAFGEHIWLDSLEDKIGQFPYRSPTVFNFFDAEFQPISFSGHVAEQIVAPEFQIFTSPFAIMFQNGFDLILKNGISACDTGFGYGDVTSSCNGKGGFKFGELPTTNETLRGLDVLLTGGRLSPKSAEVVRRAYEEAADGERVQAAERAIAFTAEFHNYGDPKPGAARPEPRSVVFAKPHTDYKAMVLLFLNGGADTYHMLVPTDCALYDEYAERRKGLVHDQSKLLPLTASTQDCTRFGLHPSFPFIHDMYETKKKAAFMSNIGSLVEPTTREQFKQESAQLCIGLFSHSHSKTAAQTLNCQVFGTSPRGVGGRMADNLAESGLTTTSFSISGTAIWPQGMDTSPNIISKDTGATRLATYEIWQDAIGNITSQRHGNIYCDEYVQSFKHAIEESETLGAQLQDVAPVTDYKTPTGLSKQLMQVARLIASRETRNADRDFFFVERGGFDTHSGITATLLEAFTEVDEALRDFVAELEAQGVFDQTVIITESDFGRTLEFNGEGTDHGWGGNHIVLGGQINGGQIFNKFIKTFAEGSEYDAGRGRVIPEYPWESMLVPIAEWMGVTDASAVFPNLGNFNRSAHIADGLFKA